MEIKRKGPESHMASVVTVVVLLCTVVQNQIYL